MCHRPGRGAQSPPRASIASAIARFSRADAQAYRRLLAEYDAVKDVFARQRFTPVGFGPSFEEMLRGRPGGQRWLRRAAMSASAIVRHEFDSRHVQAFMLWMAFQTGQPVDSAGSGPLAYSIVFSRQRRSWTIPQGGSGELARALVEVIQGAGGEVLCEQTVVGLVLREGRSLAWRPQTALVILLARLCSRRFTSRTW